MSTPRHPAPWQYRTPRAALFNPLKGAEVKNQKNRGSLFVFTMPPGYISSSATFLLQYFILVLTYASSKDTEI